MSKHSIKITSIYCKTPSERNISDGDELYLECQADGGFSVHFPSGINQAHNMESGDTWNITDDNGEPLILNFEYEVLITLWDHDLNDDPNAATYLQSVDFQAGSGNSSVHLVNKRDNKADYTLYYEYLD